MSFSVNIKEEKQETGWRLDGPFWWKGRKVSRSHPKPWIGRLNHTPKAQKQFGGGLAQGPSLACQLGLAYAIGLRIADEECPKNKFSVPPPYSEAYSGQVCLTIYGFVAGRTPQTGGLPSNAKRHSVDPRLFKLLEYSHTPPHPLFAVGLCWLRSGTLVSCCRPALPQSGTTQPSWRSC